MTLRGLFEATIGRRLVVRIWAHGVLLFAGVLVTLVIGRLAMSEHDAAAVMRSHPYLAQVVVDRVLALSADPAALAHELRQVDRGTPLDMSVYAADGALLGSSIAPPLPPPTAGERAAAHPPAWASGRLVLAASRGGPGAAIAVLRVVSPPSARWHAVVLLLCALILAFVFVAAPLARSTARPIEQLGRLARELGAGNLAVRANTDRHDELGDLARSFDTMAGQIQNLRAAERQLLGDVSHELRTPLARMRVVLDLASDAELSRARKYLSEITTDLDELAQLVDDIIVSARLDPGAARWDEARPPLRRTRTSVDDLIDASLARFRSRWTARRIDDRRARAPLEVDGDPALLRRVLDNLLDNACTYSADSEPVVLRVDHQVTGARREVRIEVADRGIGIAREDRARVFSPFFRADRSRTRASGGVGLGLALARRIVEAHGGTIGFDSAVDQGSRFWFVLELAR